jgi:hypothetical protein
MVSQLAMWHNCKFRIPKEKFLRLQEAAKILHRSAYGQIEQMIDEFLRTLPKHVNTQEEE